MSARSAGLLRGMLAVFGALVTGQALLGFAGLLGGRASIVWALGIGLVSCIAIFKAGAGALRSPLFPTWRSYETATIAALAATLAAMLHAAVGRQSFIYDTLSFHFYFPASWLASGRLEIVPTLFGDVAPAYNPSNVELLFHLAMAPLASDYLARGVQIPVALLAVVAIYVGSRELGSSRMAALTAGLVFLWIPIVWWNGVSGGVDLALASFLLACLALLARLWKRPEAVDTVFLAIAYGLFIGTKFVALPFSLPIVLAAAAVAWKHRHRAPQTGRLALYLVIGLGLVTATGGFWYLRNLLATGNPIYPLAVQIAGITVLPGLQDSASMREWIYHRPVADLEVLLRLVFGGARGFMVVGCIALLFRRRGHETWLAAILLAVFWFLVPYQHPRFLLAFYGLVAAAMALLVGPGRRAWLAYLALFSSLVLSALQMPRTELAIVALVALVGASIPWFEKRRSAAPIALIALALLAASLAPGYGRYEAQYPGYEVPGRDHLSEAWRWVRDNIQGERIAYTGTNLPYPLFGIGLENRVHYAPTFLEAGARIHDYGNPEPGSGMQVTRYRDHPDRAVWLENLRTLGSEVLFVSRLAPLQRERLRSDAEGFPIEHTWADELAELFELRYENRGVRIYRIELDASQRPREGR